VEGASLVDIAKTAIEDGLSLAQPISRDQEIGGREFDLARRGLELELHLREDGARDGKLSLDVQEFAGNIQDPRSKGFHLPLKLGPFFPDLFEPALTLLDLSLVLLGPLSMKGLGRGPAVYSREEEGKSQPDSSFPQRGRARSDRELEVGGLVHCATC
jgi:hypothetical protein